MGKRSSVTEPRCYPHLGFFIMRYDATCENCGTVEVKKLMIDEFPLRHSCGGTLTRVFCVTAVHYASSGFHTTDNRLESLVGSERNAKFEAEKADALIRQKEGKLTEYEQTLETI